MSEQDERPRSSRHDQPCAQVDAENEARLPYGKQPCLQCGYPISAVSGSKAAICPRCGFKDPCC